MENGNQSYKKFPGKKRKLFGSDRLWVGHDHLLLVESTGISEEYKRFYYKDVQAINLVKTKKAYYLSLVFGILLLISAGACVFSMMDAKLGPAGFFGIIAIVFAVFIIRLWLGRGITNCWMYSSVQKEKLTPVNTIKKAETFYSIVMPRIEKAQGSLSKEVLETQKQRVESGGVGTTDKLLSRNAKKTPVTISTIFHQILFFLFLILGVMSIFCLYNRSAGMLLFAGLVFMLTVIFNVISLARQAGSSLPNSLKNITIASIVFVAVAGIAGYFEYMFFLVSMGDAFLRVSHNQWEMLRLVAQVSPFDYPVLLAIDIVTISFSFILGCFGLLFVRRQER